jgi:hypothetical protein
MIGPFAAGAFADTFAEDRDGLFRAESLEVGVFSVSEKKNSPLSSLSALKSPLAIGAGARSSTIGCA